MKESPKLMSDRLLPRRVANRRTNRHVPLGDRLKFPKPRGMVETLVEPGSIHFEKYW